MTNALRLQEIPVRRLGLTRNRQNSEAAKLEKFSKSRAFCAENSQKKGTPMALMAISGVARAKQQLGLSLRGLRREIFDILALFSPLFPSFFLPFSSLFSPFFATFARQNYVKVHY